MPRMSMTTSKHALRDPNGINRATDQKMRRKKQMSFEADVKRHCNPLNDTIEICYRDHTGGVAASTT